MWTAIALLIFVPLGVLSLRGVRWAYVAYVILGLLWIPARAGFHVGPPPCEFALTLGLALYSLTNYRHIILFAIFFLMTFAQLRKLPKAFLWSTLACIAMGILIELEEGVTGAGHCRFRDLVPDIAGAFVGLSMIAIWRELSPR